MAAAPPRRGGNDRRQGEGVADVHPLFLRPLAPRSRRVWRIGGALPGKAETLFLPVAPDDHRSFASFRAALEVLGPRLPAPYHGDLARIAGYLADAAPPGDSSEGHLGLMSDAVTFAIMRRISRESVYTARLIDLGARLLLRAIGEMGVKFAVVRTPERLDRPSLKILARAMLLLGPEDGFSWIWSSDGDPLADPAGAEELLVDQSRRALCQQLAVISAPMIERLSPSAPTSLGSRDRQTASLTDVSRALVLQNYDACFLWAPKITDSAEGARLEALAATNIGRLGSALAALAEARATTRNLGRQAHLCYLHGLIEAKRGYDLSASDAQYKDGLELLERGAFRVGDDDDLALERAWLLNGLALNEAIAWRRTGRPEKHRAAFNRVQEAFALVHEGDSPARTYLRFNLVANSAFLMEMIGRYDLAIQTLVRGFGPEEGSTLRSADAQTTMAYRLGLLHERAGSQGESERLLSEAETAQSRSEYWPTHERILRAVGWTAFRRGDWDRATEAYRRGLAECRSGRSAEGARIHAKGLVASLIQQGRASEATAVVETLLEEEGLGVLDAKPGPDQHAIEPVEPSPKLPPYIPEIDLEEIPRIDVNRFLANVTPSSGAGGPWTG